MDGLLNNQRFTGLLAEGGLILLGCAAPLCLGGVHRPTIIAASTLSCLTLLAVWLYRRSTKRGLRIPLFGGVLVGLTLFTALQLLPLPLGLLALLAPATRELLEVSVAGAGLTLGWHPISLDPGATLLEALKVGSCALAFIVAHNLFYRAERRDRLLLALVCTGVTITLLGFIGAAAAPGRPLMFYEPGAGGGTGLIVTSFVNPNHGAAFLVLCTLAAISLAMDAADLQHRVLLGLAGVLTGSGVFLTLSRGGILVLALGLGLFAALLVWGQRGNRGVKQAALVTGGLALILGLSGWLAFDAILAEFLSQVPEGTSNLGKIALWPAGAAMVLANPWVGVGRGAFQAAFTRYLDGATTHHVTYSHMENQYLHLPAELGLLVGGGAILLSAVCLVLWVRKGQRDAPSMALAAGLIALAVHNLVDFNLELLGLALPAAILAGLLSAGHREPEHRRRKSSSRGRRRSSGQHSSDSGKHNSSDPGKHNSSDSGKYMSSSNEGSSGGSAGAGEGSSGGSAGEGSSGKYKSSSGKHKTTSGKLKTTSRAKAGRGKVHIKTSLITAAGVFALTLWAWAADRPGADESLSIIAGQINNKASLDKIRITVQQAVALHPADYLLHLAMSRSALQVKRPEAMSWLNRALYLYPSSPELHMDAARALTFFGRRTQAILEYRLALENGAPSGAALRAGLALSKDAAEVGRLLIDDPQVHADAVQILLEHKRHGLAEQIVTAAKKKWSGNVALLMGEIDVLLATDRRPEAKKAARRLARLIPRPETYLTWGRTARDKEATKILSLARRKFPQDRPVAMALVRALVRGKQFPRAREVSEEILQASRTPGDLAQAHDLLAEVYGADGRAHRAQYEREQATKIRQGL